MRSIVQIWPHEASVSKAIFRTSLLLFLIEGSLTRMVHVDALLFQQGRAVSILTDGGHLLRPIAYRLLLLMRQLQLYTVRLPRRFIT